MTRQKQTKSTKDPAGWAGSWLLAIGMAVAASSGLNAGDGALAGRFESLGKPVSVGRLHHTYIGPDAQGRMNWIYQAYGQAKGGGAFLLVTDPTTGMSRQYALPEAVPGGGAWGAKTIYSHDGIVYVGTYKTAYLLRFDPRQPEKGLQVCGGGPLEGGEASYVWQIETAADGQLYIIASPNQLFSYDIASDAVTDLGRLTPESTGNKYAQEMGLSQDRGTLYIAVGTQKHNVIAYDVASGKSRALLDEDHQAKGFLMIRPGSYVLKKGIEQIRGGEAEEQAFYALPHSSEYAIYLGREKVILRTHPKDQPLVDGSILASATAEQLSLRQPDGSSRTIPLNYDAGTQLMSFWPWGDRVYFSSTAPMKMGYYDPQENRLEVLGRPVALAGGNIRPPAQWRGKMVLSAYSGSDLALYDPAKPWNKGPTPDHNPWTWGYADGTHGGHFLRHTHPNEIVAGSDGLIYLASDPDRGREGGFVCIDPNKGETLYEELVGVSDKGPTPQALAADPERPVIYRGHRDGRVSAWDAERREVLWEVAPEPREQSRRDAWPIAALHVIDGNVVGSTYNKEDLKNSTFFQIEPAHGRLLNVRTIPFGDVIWRNLRPGPDSWLYGLTRSGTQLFRVHPGTGEAQAVADAPKGSQSYGMAVTRHGIYFARGGEMMRYRFDEPLVSASASR